MLEAGRSPGLYTY